MVIKVSKIDELLKNEKVEWKKLGEIGDFYSGITGKKKDDFINGNKKFITYKNVYSNPATNLNIDDKVKINDVENQKKLEYGDILFTASSETPDECGISSVITENISEDVYLNSFCFLLRPKKDILLPDFAKHLFRSYKLRIAISKTASGVTRFNVSKELMKKIEIPIPSIETQEKIVNILDKFTNYVTELQAELQARNKQYSYYRDMLLSEEYLNKISMKMDVLTNKDYELKMTTLGEIAQVNRGASPRPIKKYITEDIKGIPWIKIGDVGVNSKYVTKTAQKITLEGAKKSRILKKGDFIMSNSMSYGRPYILGIDGAIHDGWASISGFYNTLDSDFLYYYLTSSKVQNYWKGKINSSSVDNLNSEIICSLPIPVIDKELQQVVAKVLDKFQSLLDDTEGLLPEEIEKRQKQYEYYREKLLTFDENMIRERERERESISF